MSFQLVRYHGWYSNQMRGDRKKRDLVEPATDQPADDRGIDIRSFKSKRIPQLMWWECIKRVWEMDPLLCRKCSGEMKIISFICERAVRQPRKIKGKSYPPWH
jgi:hypothetical protein